MMVDELRTMLREAVATPPEDDHTLLDVVRRGSRARRRRTALKAGLAGAAVLAVVGGTALAGGLGGRQAVPGPGDGVEDRTTLGDAVPAGGRPVAEARETVSGTTEDGLGLLWDENEGPAGYSVRLGLLDPANGGTTWLPDAPAVPSEPLELGEDRLVFLTEVEQVGPQVGVYDRDTGTWSLSTWDGLRGTFSDAAMGPEGRLWFSRNGRLLSGSLDDPADVRDEGLTGDLFDIDGSTLVSLDEGARSAAVTDLDARTTRSIEVPDSSPRCTTPTVDVGGDLVALGWSCGYSGNLADPQPTEARALVLTTDGDVVADVHGLPGNLRLDAHVVGGDVLLTSPSPSTTYDPEVCSFPFDGMPQHYLDAWSDAVTAQTEAEGTPDGWEYCQVSHQVYRRLVLPHLDEAQVPEKGYGYYVVEGDSGRLLQLTTGTPYVAGWGFSGDGRIPAGTAIWD